MMNSGNMDALSNWEQIRLFLCERIGRQRTALARLASGMSAEIDAPVPGQIDTAAQLIAMLLATEKQLDSAFDQRSRRPVDTPAKSESRPQDSRDFLTR